MENSNIIPSCQCISYLAGGLFGDFIHQLSVIKEKYMNTGKKGILYISNNGESFRLGLEDTYQKTYNMLISQDYIQCYKIHNEEPFDINLCSWRYNRFLYHENWYRIFSDEYSIEWGKNQWITVNKEDKWTNKVVINEPMYRFSNIDYQKLYDVYSDRLVFIAFKEPNYSDYEFFTTKTGLTIEYYDPITMDELAVVINSCSLFVGAPSGIMAVAFALKSPILLGRPPSTSEYVMVKTLSNNFSNISIEDDS